MEYSGPVSITDIEADLLLSDDDDLSIDHWPPLDSTSNHETTTRNPASTKRPIEHDSDTSSAPSSPAAKTSKRSEAIAQHGTSEHRLPGSFTQTAPLRSTLAAPAFAPRDEYVKLAFKENPSSDEASLALGSFQDVLSRPGAGRDKDVCSYLTLCLHLKAPPGHH